MILGNGLDLDFERLTSEDLQAALDIYDSVLEGTHDERNQKAYDELRGTHV
jgi:hypothetical protein